MSELDNFPLVTATAESLVTESKLRSYGVGYYEGRPTTYGHLCTRVFVTICTQRTGTDAAMRGASIILDTPWTSYGELYNTLETAHTGLYERKATAIWHWLQANLQGRKLMGHPERNMGIVGHTGNSLALWRQARLRLMTIAGLGPKLASMLLFLFSPFECPLLIVDSWFAGKSLYNINPASLKQYQAAEDHWFAMSKRKGWRFPGIAREIVWDAGPQRRMEAMDSNWWAHILRTLPKTPLVDKFRDKPLWVPTPSL